MKCAQSAYNQLENDSALVDSCNSNIKKTQEGTKDKQMLINTLLMFLLKSISYMVSHRGGGAHILKS